MSISPSEPCWIIGVLDAGPSALSHEAERLLSQAELVLADERFLTLFQPLFLPEAEQRIFPGHFKELPGWITAAQAEGKRVVVLASGDPLFSGVAGHLHRRLPAGSFRVLPAPSLAQLAFARLALPWTNARLLSVHSGDGGDWSADAPANHPLIPLCRALLSSDLLAVLTSPANGPQRIARLLLALQMGDSFRLTVAERLSSPEERLLRDLSAAEVAAGDFNHPNLLILQRNSAPPVAQPLLGLSDSQLCDPQQSGLITKREIRVLALANLALQPQHILWDIGAGTGSVGLEAARLLSQGWVYAIEKDPHRCDTIRRNRAALGVFNHQVQCGTAPTFLEQWPAPNAIFIGGSGGQLAPLIQLAASRLQPAGRLVITLVTLETLSPCLEQLQQQGFAWTLSQIAISHSRPIRQQHRLLPDNPVWMITAWQNAPPFSPHPYETR
ncbi:MAG: precorrin-6y C5,15-methyltransferase (decarboxylating) subunit CbiE [Magnetococcales bacterium]|nr:precorrin-6y C5,15-methyltransferase (decarboxylating) subunit CbiE [Magnetococcales bacterium]